MFVHVPAVLQVCNQKQPPSNKLWLHLQNVLTPLEESSQPELAQGGHLYTELLYSL